MTHGTSAWSLCCAPHRAQLSISIQGAGLFDSQPWESIWSSLTAAATPSHALQQKGTLKAACSIMPLETQATWPSWQVLSGGNDLPHAPYHKAGTVSLWNSIQFLD